MQFHYFVRRRGAETFVTHSQSVISKLYDNNSDYEIGFKYWDGRYMWFDSIVELTTELIEVLREDKLLVESK